MIALIQDVSDSAIARPHVQVNHALASIFGAALPNVWVMAGITVGLLVLLAYLLRVPHQFPLRGIVMAFTALAFVGSGVVLGIQVWHAVPHDLPDAKAEIKAAEVSAEQQKVEQQPVAALDTYVPPMPGSDSAVRHAQPSMNGLPSGTVWDELTNQSVAQVVKYYTNDDNHPGWQVEFSAPNGMVLRRTITAGGQLANERLRILARPNVDPRGKKTEIEFELTRRLK
jgi:hypothetical protein